MRDQTAGSLARIEQPQSPSRQGLDPLTFEQVMKKYGVPGVSVAIIQDFRVDLMQLYLYDICEYEAGALDERGLFGLGHYFDLYWIEAERHPFLIWADDQLVGFALVRETTRMVHSRRSGPRRIQKDRYRSSATWRTNNGSKGFAIKAEVSDPGAKVFAFSKQKTMYGGRHVAGGDTIFVFASENEGGPGLLASGIVTSAEAVPKKHGMARQTPRVSITIRRTALAKRRLGRSELRLFSKWNDGRPETELNFKFYRQATNKIVGISDEAAAFLRRFF